MSFDQLVNNTLNANHFSETYFAKQATYEARDEETVVSSLEVRAVWEYNESISDTTNAQEAKVRIMRNEDTGAKESTVGPTEGDGVQDPKTGDLITDHESKKWKVFKILGYGENSVTLKVIRDQKTRSRL